MCIDRLLNAAEVAEMLSVPESWVRETTRSGAMPHVELGRYKRYRRDDIEVWLETCSHDGRPTTFRRHQPRLHARRPAITHP